MTNDADEVGAAAERVVADFLYRPEGPEPAAMFLNFGRGRVCRQLLDLVRTIAGGAEPPRPVQVERKSGAYRRSGRRPGPRLTSRSSATALTSAPSLSRIGKTSISHR